MSESNSAQPQAESTPVKDAVLQRDLLLAQKQRSGRNRLLVTLVTLPVLIVLLGLAFTATRAVDVLVTPQEAASGATIELQEGIGAIVAGKLYLLSDIARIQVSSPTYIPASLDVLPDAIGSYVEVELAPQPAKVTLTLASDEVHLKETLWRLNGELIATGKSLTTQLEADDYDLEIDHPFYQLKQHKLSLSRGETFAERMQLEPVQGIVNLASTPSGAQVLIDGEVTGTSNTTLPLPGGEYELALRLKDHGSIRETIRIDRIGHSIQRDYQLLVNAATLAVAVTPAAGTLLLNGRVEQPNNDLVVSARSEQVVTYQKPGYHSQTRRLTLEPGATQTLNFTLQENIGEVIVRSEPAASVAIDGRPAGQTPLTLKLSAVPHTVTLTKAGYHSVSRTVEPSDSGQKLINLTLLTELNHRLQNMPRELDNPAGIRLIRFQPNDAYQMGAPRSELGQRANETLRPVRLNKAFYVSQTEITNAQFNQFSATSAQASAGNLPRTNISWAQAAAYCNWLSEREGLTAIYSFNGGRYLGANFNADGYRLPSEAEWEWLARKAGRRTLNRFTWGDEYSVPTGSGNLADESAKAQVTQFVPQYTDGFPGIAPVKSFALDAAQLADMSGNVSEWVHDYYQITPATLAKETANPTGPEFGEGHVTKGSSWRSGTATTLRASYREPASQGRDDLGFRVARYVYGAE